MTKYAPVLSIDFETASLVDLKRTGARAYSLHPSTQVLCMAYTFDGGQTVRVWRIGQPFPHDILEFVAAGGTVRGWNVGFEWLIWNNTLLRQLFLHHSYTYALSLNQLEDTMAAAAYWGLPLSLDAAGPAAGLTVQKDKAGHALMMRMCRPRSVDPVSGKVVWWHDTDSQKFEALCRYCEQDVRVEAAIAATLPPVPRAERDIWVLDQQINARGVGLDTDLAMKLQALARQVASAANARINALTGGAVRSVTSTAALLAYVQAVGYPHADLKKDTVAKRLDEPECTGLERTLLELRADTAKTSAAKLQAMLDACTERLGTGSVYGMLQYYGASRTGRWAGRLIQMQNLPRGSIKNVIAAVNMVLSGASLDMIEALFGSGMGVITSLLRSCIVARPGHKLVVADYSQIEARVLPWLAGQNDVLDVFASGRDLYIYTASRVTGTPESQIDKESPLRQLGKVLVLACGFGMSGGKFRATAEGYNIFLSEAEADKAVRDWRGVNDKVVAFWWECDRAARNAIANPSQQFQAAGGRITYGMVGNHLVCRLPSGRHLVYRDARLVPNPDRPGQDDISYMGVDQYTRKWTRLRTYGGKLVENIVQAVARDIMADTLLRAAKDGMRPILTVHDELLCEEPESHADGRLAHLLKLMAAPPAWAAGLPLKGEGWVGDRYKK